MDPRSPLEYSRDRERIDRETQGPTPSQQPALTPSPTFYETVMRTLERHEQLRVVVNPKGRGPAPAPDPEISRTGASSHAQAMPERVEVVPRRPKRTREISHAIGLHTRPEERRLLAEVGKFRVVSVADAARLLYDGNLSRLKADLDYLRGRGLVEIHTLNMRRDGRREAVRRFQAITLTKEAKRLLERNGEIPEGQRIYAGMVKRREAEHDCQIYPVCEHEAERLRKQGAEQIRLRLDFELKASFNRSVYLARKADPSRDLSDIKQDVAREMHLKIIEGKAVIPDARLDYDLPSGGSAQLDIEVATAAYRRGHLAAKAQAGFKLFVSKGDIGRLGAAVQDDHDLMSEILAF